MSSWIVTLLAAIGLHVALDDKYPGFVPDAPTAIKIASAIVERRYQSSLESGGFVYSAEAYKGRWIVYCGPGPGVIVDDGVVHIALDMATGRVSGFTRPENGKIKQILDEVEPDQLYTGDDPVFLAHTALVHDAALVARAYGNAFAKNELLTPFDSRRSSQREKLLAWSTRHWDRADQKALISALNRKGRYFVSSPSVVGVKPRFLKAESPTILVFSQTGQLVGGSSSAKWTGTGLDLPG